MTGCEKANARLPLVRAVRAPGRSRKKAAYLLLSVTDSTSLPHQGQEGPVLHPEAAWPRRWVRGRWMLAGLVVLLALVAGAIVAAVVVVAGDEKAPSPAAQPATVPAPESFEAQAADFTVRLSWARPTGGVPITHYDIYRT